MSSKGKKIFYKGEKGKKHTTTPEGKRREKKMGGFFGKKGGKGASDMIGKGGVVPDVPERRVQDEKRVRPKKKGGGGEGGKAPVVLGKIFIPLKERSHKNFMGKGEREKPDREEICPPGCPAGEGTLPGEGARVRLARRTFWGGKVLGRGGSRKRKTRLME